MDVDTKKIKIAFLSFYSGEIYRGGETFVHELANRLSFYGYEVTVFQNGPKLPESKYKTVSMGIPIDWNNKNLSIPFFNYWTFLIRSFTSSVLSKMDKNTDIVFPTNGQWQSLLVRVWCFRNKKKLVISGQSGIGLDDRFNLWSFPNIFVPISTKALNWAKSANPFVKTKYIPNGADLNKFTAHGKKLKTNLKRPIILCVGALVSQKQIDLVINAVSKIPKVNLLIAGDGPLKNELVALASKVLKGRFEFISIPHNKMPDVYRAADLFTLVPNHSESFGIVYVEAMASGLPVVAIDDEQRREIVGQAGLVIGDPSNADEYALVLKKALLVKWGNKPRIQAEKFSWDDIAKEYEKLFKSLI